MPQKLPRLRSDIEIALETGIRQGVDSEERSIGKENSLSSIPENTGDISQETRESAFAPLSVGLEKEVGVGLAGRWSC